MKSNNPQNPNNVTPENLAQRLFGSVNEYRGTGVAQTPSIPFCHYIQKSGHTGQRGGQVTTYHPAGATRRGKESHEHETSLYKPGVWLAVLAHYDWVCTARGPGDWR